MIVQADAGVRDAGIIAVVFHTCFVMALHKIKGRLGKHVVALFALYVPRRMGSK